MRLISAGRSASILIAWRVMTRSPLAFDEPVRPDFGLPYRHGRLPFILIRAELNEQGVYSSRGVTETVAPFETSACKVWNEKHDAMSFYNRPLYYAEKDIPNVSAIHTPLAGGACPAARRLTGTSPASEQASRKASRPNPSLTNSPETRFSKMGANRIKSANSVARLTS